MKQHRIVQKGKMLIKKIICFLVGHKWVISWEEKIHRDWFWRPLPIVKGTFTQRYCCQRCLEEKEREQYL